MFGDQAKIPFKRKFNPLISIGIAFFFLFTGCTNEKAPVGVLSEPEMVSILTDIYLAEEKAGRAMTPFDSAKKMFPRFEKRVFEKAGIPDSVFKKSMEYYMTQPKKLEHIYTALVDSLSLKSQSAPSAITQ